MSSEGPSEHKWSEKMSRPGETTMTGERVEPLVLGRYMLCDAIGGGGMARVHVGRVIGAAGFSRVVAIKRLHPASANDPEFSTMIIDEARMASRIRHPNVVPTLDVVAVGRELLLVMEYVHGVSVAQLVRLAKTKGVPIPLSISLRITQDTLAGLQAAHEAKSERGRPLDLVHRDISPQNVLLGTDGIARIVDFGIAKAEGKLTMTRDGQIKGKLAYMAPEQLRGDEVDRRTDIYAVGVMLWELITGRRLFDRRADDLIAAVQAVTTSMVPLVSDFASVPFALNGILSHALEPDPSDRHPTADAMSTAIDALAMTATPKELAAFVNDLAKVQLDKRSEVVNRAEQTSEIHNLPPEVQARIEEAVKASPRASRPTYGSSPPVPLPVVPPPSAMTDPTDTHAGMGPGFGAQNGLGGPGTGTGTSTASGSGTRTPMRLPMDRPKRGSIVAVAIIFGAALGLLLLVAGRSCLHAKPTATTTALVSGQVPPPPTLEVPPPSTDDAPPPTIPIPTSPPGPGPGPGPGPTRIPSKSGPIPPKPPPPSPGPTTTRPDCNPPYSINEKGIRIPKRECFDAP